MGIKNAILQRKKATTKARKESQNGKDNENEAERTVVISSRILEGSAPHCGGIAKEMPVAGVMVSHENVVVVKLQTAIIRNYRHTERPSLKL